MKDSPWVHSLTIIISIMGIMAWNSSEIAAVRRELSQEINVCVEKINLSMEKMDRRFEKMTEEFRDFHGRLVSLEVRYREKHEEKIDR